MPDNHTVYDVTKDYEWNYQHVPAPEVHGKQDILPVPGKWTYAGLPVASPFAMSAGPLLNSRWVAYYARLGFDILTYKTVRRCGRKSYAPPNLVPVDISELNQSDSEIMSTTNVNHSWAVSFGMPSREPATWQEDVEKAKESLLPGQLLSVSVVATPQTNDNILSIAKDYSTCAIHAFDSGADVVEVNFSCPNVATRDGMLYTQPNASSEVLQRVREAIQDRPLLVKLGYIQDEKLANQWVQLSEGLVQGLVMVNCIGAKVLSPDGNRLFEGNSRGIAGKAIRAAVQHQVQMFQSIIRKNNANLRTVAVGGISTLEDIQHHLNTGAECIQIATAAMIDPLWAVRRRKEWYST